jgi:hypothetical protein
MPISKQLLSGSTGGLAVKVAATASAGTIIHTTGTSASVIDELWLYATNSSLVDNVDIIIEFGGTTSPDHRIAVSIPPSRGISLVVAGFTLTGTGSVGRIVRAYASTANLVMIYGYVNRITP